MIREGVEKQTRSKQGIAVTAGQGVPKQGYSNSVTAGQDRPEARCHFSETSRGGADTAKASLHHRSPFPSLSSFSDKGSALRTSHSVFFISLILHFWGWQESFKPSFYDWNFSERWHIYDFFLMDLPNFLTGRLDPIRWNFSSPHFDNLYTLQKIKTGVHTFGQFDTVARQR